MKLYAWESGWQLEHKLSRSQWQKNTEFSRAEDEACLDSLIHRHFSYGGTILFYWKIGNQLLKPVGVFDIKSGIALWGILTLF